MKALSLWQPWASLVVLGEKRIETRSWGTVYRGDLLIQAAQSRKAADIFYEEPFKSVLARHGIKHFGDLPYGALIGCVNLASCIPTDMYSMEENAQEQAFGDFSPGRTGWGFRDARSFASPIPYRGSQGLFDVPDDVVAEALGVKR